jgi:hypothetical protein
VAFQAEDWFPEEIAAEKRLDEVTREVAWGEFDKEAAHEAPMGPFAPLGMTGATEGPLKGDPDPTDEHGLREALREGEEKS